MIFKIDKNETNLRFNVDYSNSACFLYVYNLLLLLYKKHLFRKVFASHLSNNIRINYNRAAEIPYL